MSGISIQFSGVTFVTAITVRVTGGEFRIVPGGGFALTGNIHSVCVTGDAVYFSPSPFEPSGSFAGR